MDPRFKIKLKTRKKVKVEKYVKGSHGFITYSQLLLKLLRMERDALANLLDYSGIDENEMDQTFIKLSEEAINTFVKHAEEVWKKKHRSKVLALLDILENCERLVPEFRDLLHSNSDKILDMIEQLRKATNKALEDRIESIYQHSFKDSPSDGGYSSITVQTMTFIKSLYEYRTIVESMFSHSSRINLPGIHTEMKKENIESPTTIGKIFVSILQVLQSNLEQKANSYKNSSLSSIFLINNYHYMIKSIKSSNLVDALGGIIIHHFESLFLEARKAYKDFTWTKLLSHISLDLNKELVTKVASGELNSNTKKAIKAKFDNFNSIFEELCATQKQFSVPDADLKSRLRNENIETIVPIYKAFVHKFGSLEFSKHAAKYIRYREMVLEQMLNKFFEEA